VAFKIIIVALISKSMNPFLLQTHSKAKILFKH